MGENGQSHGDRHPGATDVEGLEPRMLLQPAVKEAWKDTNGAKPEDRGTERSCEKHRPRSCKDHQSEQSAPVLGNEGGSQWGGIAVEFKIAQAIDVVDHEGSRKSQSESGPGDRHTEFRGGRPREGGGGAGRPETRKCDGVETVDHRGADGGHLSKSVGAIAEYGVRALDLRTAAHQ